ncbi:phage tail protein [uncultured Acidaminococcus sp.]|uniref:phage tail protein n=1 Tax=uncultured Acidaminococcus sp. TaxID=352152 RepID=UPI00258B74A6|nr:phage tail protein [uncultured Acidaminococcus sp.]
MGIFKSHTTYNRADKISNFTVTTAEYGSAVPEVFGTTRRSGNVIYYDDFTAHEHRESHKAGKGGRKKTVTITYTYTVATILGLCEGPINGIGKVWVGKSVYDYPNDDIGLTCWTGTDTQKPWAYVQGKHPDKALPYKGLAYMAGVVDLGDNATFPTYNFEIKGKLLSSGDYTDANPADVIRYILDKTGLSGVAIDGLDNYRTYCRENDLLISSPMDDTSARETREIINEIINLTNAYMFWSNDHYKIVVLDDQAHGGWKPDTTIRYALTPDDLLPQSGAALVTYSRKDSSEVYNQYPVEFISRKNSYDKETVSYALSKDIAEHGVRQASTTKAHWFYTKERAVKLAEALARKAIYGRNQYTFKLDWAFCRLEVGDLVTLTDPSIGLDKQVVRISSVTEGTNGVLTFTAVSVPPMDVTAPQYDVHSQDRPYVDYNVTAPDTDTPVLIQPPADLTTNGLELWIGAKGKGDLWGGCEVYASDDGTTYRSIGMITNTARIGTLATNVTKDATTLEVSSNGDFLSGTAQDAERGNTLCWVDGECFSYQTATLLSNGHWQLSGCIRGQYFTTAAAHKAGVQFARMDATLLKAPFTKSDVGKKIWLKFVSYNIFGAGNQDLSKVKAYQYTIQPYYIPPVTGISCYNRYRQQADGVSRYDIVVKWTPPALDSYLEGRVWYKTDHGQVDNLAAAEGVSVDSMGFSGEWIFGGSGKDQVVIPQAVVGDTYRICVTTVDEWGASTSPDLAPSKDIVVALKTYIPNTPDGFTVDFGATAAASWKEVTNTDISFYEIRLDNHPGVEGASLLARTNGLKASLALTSRTGTLYLYACNALGKYSDPAVLKYSKAAPPTPAVPKLTATIGGFGIMAKAIPNGCIGMAIYIDSQDVIRTPNNVYSCTCGAGVYAVRLAYYDLFGEGSKSDEAMVTVKVEIDESMIKNEAISLDKVNAAIKDQLNKGVDAEKKVSIVVDNLNAKDGYKNYSALSQLNDAINLRVKEGDVINQINVSPESILIDGSKVHITGETYFDDNIVTSKMLQAKAVTADKMSVDSLSAITANVGSLKGGTITGTQIVGTNFKNSSGSFTVDDSGNIYGATLKSGTIDGNTIRINGYNVRAVTILKGQLYMDDDHWDEPTYEDKHNGIGTMWSDGTWHHPDKTGGRYIPIPAGYDRSQCIWGVANAATAYLAQNCYFPNPSIPYVECGGMGSGGWPDTNITYWCIGIK